VRPVDEALADQALNLRVRGLDLPERRPQPRRDHFRKVHATHQCHGTGRFTYIPLTCVFLWVSDIFARISEIARDMARELAP
jgi:hypothetical protein